jgi:hypothetical protein
MTKGTELYTLMTGLNGGASLDVTLADVLVASALSILEEERPWMARRKLNSALTLTTANTWTTAKALSAITDFNRFYGDGIVTLFDGNNIRHYYAQRPFDRQLEYKDDSSSFWYDANAHNMYFGGTPPISGTLYIPYMSTSPAVDLESATDITDRFLLKALPLLGFYAVGIHKGAVDYDDINKLMMPEHKATLFALKNAMEKWDNELQLSEVENNDPTDLHSYPRSGAINRN